MKIAISFDVDGVLLPNPLADTVFKDLTASLAQEIASRRGWSLVRAEGEVRRRIREEFRHRLCSSDYPVEAFDWDAIFTQVGRELGATQSIDMSLAKNCGKSGDWLWDDSSELKDMAPCAIMGLVPSTPLSKEADNAFQLCADYTPNSSRLPGAG